MSKAIPQTKRALRLKVVRKIILVVIQQVMIVNLSVILIQNLQKMLKPIQTQIVALVRQELVA